jgi:hypothetical protein
MDLRLGSSYTYGAAWESSPPSRASRFRYHSSSQVVPFLSAFRTRESPDHRDLEVDSIAQSKCRAYHRYLVHFPPAAILCRRCDNVDWKPFPEQGHFRARKSGAVRCWGRRIGVAASARVLKGERDEEAKAKAKAQAAQLSRESIGCNENKAGRGELYLDCAIPSGHSARVPRDIGRGWPFRNQDAGPWRAWRGGGDTVRTGVF